MTHQNFIHPFVKTPLMKYGMTRPSKKLYKLIILYEYFDIFPEL
jgi:hypothetical protein